MSRIKKENLAARCVFSLAFFDKKAKIDLPVAGSVNGQDFTSFLVGKGDKTALIPVSMFQGSVDVIRSELIKAVNDVCDTFEER